MPLATNYVKTSLAPISLFVPCSIVTPSVTSFSIHDAKKEKTRQEAEVASSTEKYFHGYKFVFAIFFYIESRKANAERRLLNYELDPNQLQSSQTLTLPNLFPSEIMLLMKRNDQLGVFSLRQTSFINLPPL